KVCGRAADPSPSPSPSHSSGAANYGCGLCSLTFSPATGHIALEHLLTGWLAVLPSFAQGSDDWPVPHAVHLDFACGGFVIEQTKLAIPGIKSLVWFCTGVTSALCHFTEYDFAKIADDIFADEEKRKGRSRDEILHAVAFAWNGSDALSKMIVRHPGLADMYDYERVGHAAGAPPVLGAVLTGAQMLAKHSDGFICAATKHIEPVGVPYVTEFYRMQGKKLFSVGLSVHEKFWEEDEEERLKEGELKTFMDKALAEHGEKSVLYISFGSIFFPVATPHLIETLVETLLTLEQPFPFVFVLGSQLASLPAPLIERINSSGRGLACSYWVDQRAVLKHKATGWFLTHGGYNSIGEAISQAVPLIMWPCGAEQPLNASLLSSGPAAITFELLQVRAGPQIGPSLRFPGVEITGTTEAAGAELAGVFAKARGEEGKRLRANIEELRGKILAGRTEEDREQIKALAAF
ncbi:unnamed protein product, partial [Mycena citricolor]